MKTNNTVKIIVLVPEKYADKVRLAMGKAGAGHIGNYHYCAGVTKAKGYFLPMKGADPATGKVGQISEVDEMRIETVCEKKKLPAVIKAIKKAHPYEEVPIDVLPLLEIE